MDIDTLYQKLDCPFSAKNKDLGIPETELTYGEMTQKGFRKMLKNIDTRNKVFCDLGSGNGKLVMYSVLIHHFQKGIGIEIDPDKHQCAMKFKDKLITDNYASGQNIELYQGNFFDYDLSDADIIWISSLCFEEETLKKLGEKLARETKSGTIIFTSKEIHHPDIVLKGASEVDMTWNSKSPIHNYYKK